MRIKFERGTQTSTVKAGYFSRREIVEYTVKVEVQFSEEEKAIIATTGLSEYSWHERNRSPMESYNIPDEDNWRALKLNEHKIGWLIEHGGMTEGYHDLVQANVGEATIREDLQKLKSVIAANSGRTGAMEFEL